MQELKELGLTDDDLEGVDDQALEHVVWFTASETVSAKVVTREKRQTKSRFSSYKTFIEKNYSDIIRTLLFVHYKDDLKTPLSPLQEEIICATADIYKNSFMDDTPTIADEKIVSILEAYQVFKEYKKDAWDYEENPVFFLLDDFAPNIEEDILEKAEAFSDEDIIYLFSQFCDYNPEYQDAIILSPEQIDVKKLIVVLEKLV